MSVKILSVDDEVDLELLFTQHFRKKIRNGEYEFLFAHNGVEALQILLKHQDISIILSDINMPEMDGLTLLAKVKEMGNPALKCIMVSAYGDMKNIREAMNHGAFDFSTKPIDLDDLDRTIEKAVAEIEFIQASLREHGQLEDIRNDLSIASQIQHAILPRSFNLEMSGGENVDIYAKMDAAKDVGGDIYDFFPIDDHRFGFTIADVSGKGIPASIFMAVSRTLIKAYGVRGMSSHECMNQVNKLLCEESLNSMFVTAIYGIYDINDGTIEYTNAGHNFPFIMKSDGSVEMVKSHINLVLGIMNDVEFEPDTLKLEPGDTLITYTDGITEAENESKEQYSEQSLENLLKTLKGANSEQIVNAVLKSVRTFAAGAVQSDDITQLVIRRIN